MMAALTPHITGAISKTVNLPREATVEDVKEIYRLSWQLGVKAIALYRDGCKVSQPLSAGKDSPTERPLSEYTYQELIDYINTEKTVYKPMRVKPTGIRTARVHKATINGLVFYITTSYYEDGRLGELFVTAGKQGSLIRGLLESLSTTISKMLQYGITPKEVSKMYRGLNYEPSGFVSDHPYIKHVDSVSDLVSKIIDIEIGDYTYCQVKPDGYQPAAVSTVATVVGGAAAAAPAIEYTAADYLHGEVCSECGSSKMVKNGTCKVCAECGSTTGCS